MKKIKVSAIIPNYNHAKYLNERIQSVLDQDFVNYEVILLDDASSDKSVEIIDSFSNNNTFKICKNKTNSGSTFKQWKKGISLSSGEYIWIAESDDLADPSLLRTLVSLLENNPDVVLAYCQSNYIDEKSEIIGSANVWTDDLDPQRWRENYINTGIDECKYYLTVKNTIPNASAVVFRRSAFDQISCETNLRLCGDWVIWSRLIKLGKVAFCKEPLNYFRIHTNNVRSTTGFESTASEFLCATREIIQSVTLSPQDKLLISNKLYKFWANFIINAKFSTALKYVRFLMNLNHALGLKLLHKLLRNRIGVYALHLKHLMNA